MKTLLIIIGLFLLTGCFSTTKYDIDVTCDLTNQYAQWTIDDSSKNSITTFSCTSTTYFTIRCSSSTVQEMGRYHYCQTADGKSVRIYSKLP